MSRLYSELKRRNVLRVAVLYFVSAWLIAQIADVVTGLADLPPTVGRAVLIILAAGFPVALALAWVFEWTPEGIRRETDSEAAPATGQTASRRVDYVIIALLSVALVYFAATHDWQGRPAVASASVAVLPFENRSAQADDLFFTDGIHDDLLTRLGKIHSLVVISRTSVMSYRGTTKSVPVIARELGVATVLEGGVQRAGDRVRINVQLIDAAADRSLWAENFDRKLTAEDLFAIQSEIATSIAEALQATLLPAEQRRVDAVATRNLEAYDQYLLGLRALARRKTDGFVQARQYFNRAIELDPQFALAYAELAHTLCLYAGWGGPNPEQLVADAETAARKALELDPELGEAHMAFGLARKYRGDPPEVYAPYFERGVVLAPGSAEARKWYGDYLSASHRDDEALEQYQKAAELDPLSPIIRVNFGGILATLGRDEEALAAYQRALEIDPGFLPALFAIASSTGPDQSLVHYSAAYSPGRADPWTLVFFVWTYLELDDDARAAQWARQIERIDPGSMAALVAALNLNLYRGITDETLRLAGQMLPLEQGDIPTASRILALHDLRRGDAQAARARYADKYPSLLADEPTVGDDYPAAIDVAVVLGALGEAEAAARLLDRSLQQLPTEDRFAQKANGVMKARAYALLGDNDAALKELRNAITAGWRSQWWFYLTRDAAFDSLRDDPRFQAMVEEFRANVARQLARVREDEASGAIVLPPETPT